METDECRLCYSQLNKKNRKCLNNLCKDCWRLGWSIKEHIFISFTNVKKIYKLKDGGFQDLPHFIVPSHSGGNATYYLISDIEIRYNTLCKININKNIEKNFKGKTVVIADKYKNDSEREESKKREESLKLNDINIQHDLCKIFIKTGWMFHKSNIDEFFEFSKNIIKKDEEKKNIEKIKREYYLKSFLEKSDFPIRNLNNEIYMEYIMHGFMFGKQNLEELVNFVHSIVIH
jgi:hypothetical protein